MKQVPYNEQKVDHKMEDVVPYADYHYRTLNNPENRAVGGLSMPNILPCLFCCHRQFQLLWFNQQRNFNRRECY
jgi:hypothetical protein